MGTIGKSKKSKLTPELVAAGVAERCYSDSDSRQSFIDNPSTCLEQEAGKELPEEFEIVACENDDSKWYVPVPPSDAKEISEEDLAKIAGGELALSSVIIAVTTGVVAGLITTGVGLAVWATINLSQGRDAFYIAPGRNAFGT